MNKYILAAAIIATSIAQANAQYYIPTQPSQPQSYPSIQMPQFVPTPSTVSPFVPMPAQPIPVPQYSSPTPTYTNCAGVGAYMNCTTR
jgi:hypothetical protein